MDASQLLLATSFYSPSIPLYTLFTFLLFTIYTTQTINININNKLTTDQSQCSISVRSCQKIGVSIAKKLAATF